MPEATQIKLSHKEVAEAMVKHSGLHEGNWGLFIRFGISGMNIGQGASDVLPAGVVPIIEIGLQKFEELNNLSVDAAIVNPKK